MEKLELHHIAPYFPYLLKCIRKDGYTTILAPFNHTESIDNGITIEYLLENEFKPILRPLSDIEKKIIFNGEKIAFKNILSNSLQMQIDILNIPTTLDLKVTDYQKLIESHFDVFGLIEKGLAVDINTLKNGRG